MSVSWDIFCSVVDNYGDIGVTWRLARQLVAEHNQEVRLFVDDWVSFTRIHPEAAPEASTQRLLGVEVHHWTSEWPDILRPADVVIEAFGCPLPAVYVEAMACRTVQPLWINLEYLSAEAWVEDCHGLASPQPNGLKKFFFFPGFTAGTGGLLREHGLLERRQTFRMSTVERDAFLVQLGVSVRPGERLFSLFSYEMPSLHDWLDELTKSAEPVLLLIPEGRVLGNVARWAGYDRLMPGDVYHRRQLRIHIIPFRQQDDYDRLLWCCDFNAARGEESFIRAQWAGQPFIWHIYPQDKRAHMLKLDAFLDRYLVGLSPAAGQATRVLWHAWNGEGSLGQAWREWMPYVGELTAHAESWCARQAEHNDLASALVHFHVERLSYSA
ncbi:putative repeat protein (TIGR03837 family) [Pseudomonas duriflava]|uniref:Protein-arginine rhamnosyltransferase n=1 Tax=Pseudomonas duriflava TaxID=459528 RepID=A0A562Q2V6_9PSED|nr:elongation factor P maturation arginine rhamnosyltransferase EarP [Pseudomonas duriflava]TWI51013.1 putative repeat protein (TIGR03837 family) [Pseudomonas duriflava]